VKIGPILYPFEYDFQTFFASPVVIGSRWLTSWCPSSIHRHHEKSRCKKGTIQRLEPVSNAIFPEAVVLDMLFG